MDCQETFSKIQLLATIEYTNSNVFLKKPKKQLNLCCVKF